MPTRPMTFHGLDAEAGDYDRPPLALADFVAAARAGGRPAAGRVGVKAGVEPGDLASAGWGLVFPSTWPEERRSAILEALAPLLERRQEQASARDSRYFRRDLEAHPQDTGLRFLNRYKRLPGPADPRDVPCYLLLIGTPEELPFALEHGLAAQHAVGRLGFAEVDDYKRYAERLVEAEETVRPPRRAAFFGACHPNDPPTRTSSEQLVAPLARELERALPGWTIDSRLAESATKAALLEVLRDPPALVFTAGHSLVFRQNKERRARHQGALVMSDWQGPGSGPVEEGHFLAAADLEAGMDLRGRITFHFGCHTLGTPRFDAFTPGEPVELAERPFLAPLPLRLLAEGGALAVVGHVERAWGYSFLWEDHFGDGVKGDERGDERTATFESVLRELLAGVPVGWAVRYFGLLRLQLAEALLDALGGGPGDRGSTADPRLDELLEAYLWAAHHDARGYQVLGDPAARLQTADAVS